jgi:hypothetical protein
VIEAGVGVELKPSPDRRLGRSEQLDLDLHDYFGAAARAAILVPRCLSLLGFAHRLLRVVDGPDIER